MKINRKKIILRDSPSPTIKEFLSKSLEGFGNELETLAQRMYSYPNGLKGIYDKECINDVFSLIERSYVGLFSNAIIRVFPLANTLQEFPIYEKNKSIGRADLLVSYPINNKESINLLFEAKCSIATWKNYSDEHSKSYYNDLFNQAHKYYLAEKEYYTGSTYVVTLSFDWIKNEDLLKEFMTEFQDGVTDFYYIFHTKEAGLMVYGNVTGPL